MSSRSLSGLFTLTPTTLQKCKQSHLHPWVVVVVVLLLLLLLLPWLRRCRTPLHRSAEALRTRGTTGEMHDVLLQPSFLREAKNTWEGPVPTWCSP